MTKCLCLQRRVFPVHMQVNECDIQKKHTVEPNGHAFNRIRPVTVTYAYSLSISLFSFTSYIGSNRILETDETDEIYRSVEILCTQNEFLKYIHEHYMVTGMKVNVQKILSMRLRFIDSNVG